MGEEVPVATPATQGAGSVGSRTGSAGALLGVALGSDAGRPAIAALTGVDTSYPVTQLAVTVGVAATALPYLSRAFHRTVSFLVLVAAFAAAVDGSALPVNAVSSLAIGWGVAALLHLAAGSPLGLPSAEEVSAGIADLDLDVAVDDIVRAPNQVWGVERFGGRDPDGNTVELSVYGRDAADARVLAKLWRFCFYRDSGPTLILDRIQQVEHEAYVAFMAARWFVAQPGARSGRHNTLCRSASAGSQRRDIWAGRSAEQLPGASNHLRQFPPLAMGPARCRDPHRRDCVDRPLAWPPLRGRGRMAGRFVPPWTRSVLQRAPNPQLADVVRGRLASFEASLRALRAPDQQAP
jgi:hypothetical protein